MVKRTITETIEEYNSDGNLIRKTITETYEEEDNTKLTYPSYTPYDPSINYPIDPYITWCNGTSNK